MKLSEFKFEVPLEDQKPCEFLVRLETAPEEILTFHDKLEYAIEHPVPHPWLNDVFHKAVTGSTPQELQNELLKKYGEEREEGNGELKYACYPRGFVGIHFPLSLVLMYIQRGSKAWCFRRFRFCLILDILIMRRCS